MHYSFIQCCFISGQSLQVCFINNEFCYSTFFNGSARLWNKLFKCFFLWINLSDLSAVLAKTHIDGVL